jgi:hypothetical protein
MTLMTPASTSVPHATLMTPLVASSSGLVSPLATQPVPHVLLGWCSTHLPCGSSSSDANLLGYQLSTIQALHCRHCLSHPKISSGCPNRSSWVGDYGGRVRHPHVQLHLGLSSTPSRCECCHRQVDLQTQVQRRWHTREVQGLLGSSLGHVASRRRL